jgi:hypothetical protein
LAVVIGTGGALLFRVPEDCGLLSPLKAEMPRVTPEGRIGTPRALAKSNAARMAEGVVIKIEWLT